MNARVPVMLGASMEDLDQCFRVSNRSCILPHLEKISQCLPGLQRRDPDAVDGPCVQGSEALADRRWCVVASECQGDLWRLGAIGGMPSAVLKSFADRVNQVDPSAGPAGIRSLNAPDQGFGFPCLDRPAFFARQFKDDIRQIRRRAQFRRSPLKALFGLLPSPAHPVGSTTAGLAMQQFVRCLADLDAQWWSAAADRVSTSSVEWSQACANGNDPSMFLCTELLRFSHSRTGGSMGLSGIVHYAAKILSGASGDLPRDHVDWSPFLRMNDQGVCALDVLRHMSRDRPGLRQICRGIARSGRRVPNPCPRATLPDLPKFSPSVWRSDLPDDLQQSPVQAVLGRLHAFLFRDLPPSGLNDALPAVLDECRGSGLDVRHLAVRFGNCHAVPLIECAMMLSRRRSPACGPSHPALVSPPPDHWPEVAAVLLRECFSAADLEKIETPRGILWNKGAKEPDRVVFRVPLGLSMSQHAVAGKPLPDFPGQCDRLHSREGHSLAALSALLMPDTPSGRLWTYSYLLAHADQSYTAADPVTGLSVRDCLNVRQPQLDDLQWYPPIASFENATAIERREALERKMDGFAIAQRVSQAVPVSCLADQSRLAALSRESVPQRPGAIR